MIKLRFAPSPTGFLHLGNTRQALINWLYARKAGGQFVLRIDDTDLERSRPEYEAQIIDDLRWLGLNYDETFKQSDRLDHYTRATEKLKDMGRLYACYETAEELSLQRKVQVSSGQPPRYNRKALTLTADEKAALEAKGLKPHWRFKLEPRVTEWVDKVRGPVAIHPEEMSDPVLVREDGSPVYTLASVVDDVETGITHIIRGEDHVANTAVQIQIIEALTGKPNVIEFGHTALITGGEGEGLSKRTGSLSVKDLKDQGMESMAILSLLAKLGTSDAIHPHTTHQALLDEFRMEAFGRSAPKLSLDDLWQMNGKILALMEFDQIKDRVDITPPLWSLVRGNIEKLSELDEWKDLLYGARTFPSEAPDFIQEALKSLPQDPWDETTFKTWADGLKETTGRKGRDLFMPLRLALTGQDHGPELKDLIVVMGRPQVVARLQSAAA